MHSSRTLARNRAGRWPAPTLACLLGILAITGCMDGDSPVTPGFEVPDLEVEGPPATSALGMALTCRAEVERGSFACAPVRAASGESVALSPSGDLILGGQGEFVRLASGNVGALFQNDSIFYRVPSVTVENLIGQALGTEDGTSLHPHGVRVFFLDEPTKVSGLASTTVRLARLSGRATYTAPDQGYYQYSQVLPPGQTTAGQNFWFHVDGAATGLVFEFQVLVVGQVRHRNGWIELDTEALELSVGEGRTVTATVFSPLGFEETDPVLDWTSTTPEVVTVSAAGEVQGVTDGFAGLQVESGARSVLVPVTVGSPPPPTVNSISPATIHPGDTILVEGSGFNGFVAGGNSVTVGGFQAQVLSSSAGSLEAVVPATACFPTGDVVVEAGNGSGVTSTEHPAGGAISVALAAGAQLVLDAGSSLCLGFGETGATEEYMVGIQRVSETFDAFTTVEVRSRLAPGAEPSVGLPSMWAGVAPAAAPYLPTAQELELEREYQEHLRKKAELRAVHEAMLASLGPVGAAPPRAPAPTSHLLPSVGDTLTEYSVTDGNACTDPAILQVEVRAVTPNAIFLEDIDNPARISDGAIAEWMDFFESESYPALLATFGPPSDVDGNGRVKFLSTKELNKLGPLGYVTTLDWEDRSACGASSEGEIFYMQGVDPTGTYGPVRTEANLDAQIGRVLAHEFVHVIQFGRRIAAGEPPLGGRFLTGWEAEGQATFAEMVVGLASEGRTFGQNYGFPVASTYWYGKTFFDHRFLFGWGGPSAPRIDDAPEICNWMAYQRCTPGGSPWLNYAVPSLLVQYLSDQFGVVQVNQGMIDSTLRGFENLANVTGLTEGEILARWWATLVVDGRVSGAVPELTVPSWDLHDIWSSFSENERLQPRERTFADYQDEVSIHSASTAFFRVSGEGRGSTAISFRAPGGGFLSSEAQVWVVRLQ